MDLPPTTRQRSRNAFKASIGYTKFVKYGLPFFILVIGASFGLKEFQQIKFTYFRNTKVSSEEMAKFGAAKKEGEVTLETEYDKINKIDIDNWTNKRGPRPWE